MTDLSSASQFFERPILNSPYAYSARHWELDAQGQPTQRIIESRRRAEFITPIPKPKQVKAFRDTWRDGIHSYLGYLRDRLTVARDLLKDSGSIFIQIGDENIHRVRSLLDEVFGDENFCALINFKKTGGQSASIVASVFDAILWYAKKKRRSNIAS